MKVLSVLKQNRKIAMATHNIMAYRIFEDDRKVFLHDCDNDGETSAGSQLLHMLEVCNKLQCHYASCHVMHVTMKDSGLVHTFMGNVHLSHVACTCSGRREHSLCSRP